MATTQQQARPCCWVLATSAAQHVGLASENINILYTICVPWDGYLVGTGMAAVPTFGENNLPGDCVQIPYDLDKKWAEGHLCFQQHGHLTK